jgi:hypothetical protein
LIFIYPKFNRYQQFLTIIMDLICLKPITICYLRKADLSLSEVEACSEARHALCLSMSHGLQNWSAACYDVQYVIVYH